MLTPHTVAVNPSRAAPESVTSNKTVALPTMTLNQNKQKTAAVPSRVRVMKVVKPAKTRIGRRESRTKIDEKVVAIGKLGLRIQKNESECKSAYLWKE